MSTHDQDASDLDETEFQRASAEFLERLEAVRSVESRKASLPPRDPERPGLAHRVEEMVIEILALSKYQSRLAEAQSRDVPAHRSPSVVLAEWRAAVRRLEASSVATSQDADEVARLHAEYDRATEARRR